MEALVSLPPARVRHSSNNIGYSFTLSQALMPNCSRECRLTERGTVLIIAKAVYIARSYSKYTVCKKLKECKDSKTEFPQYIPPPPQTVIRYQKLRAYGWCMFVRNERVTRRSICVTDIHLVPARSSLYLS